MAYSGDVCGFAIENKMSTGAAVTFKSKQWRALKEVRFFYKDDLMLSFPLILLNIFQNYWPLCAGHHHRTC